MKKALLLFTLLFGLTACTNHPNMDVAQVPEPTTVPTPEPTATPASTPAPEPTATPLPSQPDFFKFRSTLDLMPADKHEEYFKSLRTREIQNWSGTVVAKDFLQTGLYGATIEMDKNPMPRPDLILSGIPSKIYESLKPGQHIRFSGTFAGYSNFGNMQRILTIENALIHQE